MREKRDIRDMESGDYVKVRGQLKEIKTISPEVGWDKPVPRDFYVITTDGEKVSMYNAHSYHKKENVENINSKN